MAEVAVSGRYCFVIAGRVDGTTTPDTLHTIMDGIRSVFASRDVVCTLHIEDAAERVLAAVDHHG